jgi:serine phosphatase RsbU (regulator of sigma subunit)
LFDIALAVEPKTRYTRLVRRVALGDRVLIITDGVLEAPNEGGELFGHEGLERVLQTAPDSTPQVLVPAIIAALREHTQGASLDHDDVSILMLEFVDNLGSSALWTALKNRLFGRGRDRQPRKTNTNGSG